MKNRPVTILALFISALSLKLLIFFLATEPIIFSKYPFFAERLSQGMDIGERILDLSPLYLYLNVLFYQIYGQNWEGLALLQIFLGSLNCVLVFLIGERIFGRSVGIIAALTLLLYGNLTLIELTLEPESLVLFLNSLVVLSLIQAREKLNPGGGARRFLLPGILTGLSIITKPNGVLLLPAALIWVWWGKFERTLKFKSTFFFILAAFLVVFPITLRNYLLFQDFILITADGGKVFFHGNAPGSTGMERADLLHQGFREESQTEPDAAHALFRKAARDVTGQPLKPSECARFWFSWTLKHMAAHPSSALLLEVKKFLFFWGNYEVHDIDANYKNYLTLQRWPLLPFGFLATLGMMGLFLAYKKFRQAFLLYSLVFIYILSVLIFFAASRYRLPAAPFLAIFAAYTLTFLYSLWQRKRTGPFVAAVGILILLYLSINFPFRKEVQALDRWQMATRVHYSLDGNLLFAKRMYAEAIAEYQKAIALAPHFAPAYNRLGMCYAILNDLDQAEKNFQRVVELSPEMDQGYLNLGLLYKAKGENQKAITFLEKALARNPENQKAREYLEKLKSSTDG